MLALAVPLPALCAPYLPVVCRDLRLHGPDNGLSAIEQLRSGVIDDVPSILVTGDTGPDRLRDAADAPGD